MTVIHDVHVWSLVSGYDMATAYVLVDPSLSAPELDTLLRRVRTILTDEFGIAHASIQVEQSTQGCVEDHHHHVDHSLVSARQQGRRRLLPF